MSGNLIINGEDSETDDEITTENQIKNKSSMLNVNQNQGCIIEGEAIESDEEIISFSNTKVPLGKEIMENVKVKSSASSSKTTSPEKLSKSSYNNNEYSILHSKLFDRNVSLWQNLNALIQNAVSTSSKDLLATDQVLIKSMITLQSTSKIFKQINETSSQILQKSGDIFTGNFLPTIQSNK